MRGAPESAVVQHNAVSRAALCVRIVADLQCHPYRHVSKSLQRVRHEWDPMVLTFMPKF
jgi:hypothetical protein